MEPATAKYVSVPDFPRPSSQLDNIETTIVRQLPSSYAELRRSKHLQEFVAATDLYVEMDHADGKSRTSQLRECRQYAYFARNSETGKVRVISNSCHLRWCPICSDVKRVRLRAAVSEWLCHISRPKFITLTLAHNQIDPKEQITMLYRAFRLLRQHKSIKRCLRGGIWFFQIKRSKGDDEWHPHLHIVADSDFIDKKLLSLEWLYVTRNSFIVDIREIKNSKEVSDYVSRYCSKPCKLTDFSRTDRYKVSAVLAGKRLWGKFGSGRKCHFESEKLKGTTAWQRLGNWSDFIADRPYVPAIQKIIKAWLLDESIEFSLCKDFMHQENPAPALDTGTNNVLKQKQLCIDRFVCL